jgi:hypothetical protein
MRIPSVFAHHLLLAEYLNEYSIGILKGPNNAQNAQ